MNFLHRMFDKNKRTGECAGGTYFCMPGMIIVEEINNDTVKATLDDMINNRELGKYVTLV